ncbi:N-acyl homoserine lactonase family protein [Streptomyces aurantiacus]|uniref:N-acyl homoserine lactonase family protein n=1 Tax=Streptomyces aurantiacus TaxID=47760 RepID=A0A7G1PA29_9ACTN|nr:N-acyl homoserine lactonase family protein [Streptomyces aurantiacus]BCL30784.1 N-acyl homoserine lactonase family protein [Streptomyces aurantiacus]
MSGLEVVQVRYGERVTTKSAVLHDYASYGLPDGDLRMDYNFWVLRDGSRTMLLDTGYDIGARDWLGEQPVIPTADALALLGIDPLDVSTVITSHFHYDHIGHLGLFRNAEVVAGVAEYDYWFGKWHRAELDGEFATAGHLEAVRLAEREGRLKLVSEETEVSPGVTVHPVGGHSPGELLTVVEERLIMAADAAHFYEQIENEWPFFAFTDLGEMRRALTFINRLAAETGATVIPGHDGRVRDRFPALAGPAAGVATVLG